MLAPASMSWQTHTPLQGRTFQSLEGRIVGCRSTASSCLQRPATVRSLKHGAACVELDPVEDAAADL